MKSESLRSGPHEEMPLKFESFKARLDEENKLILKYNNLYLTVIIPPEDSNEIELVQFKALQYLERISEAQKANFLDLCGAHTEKILPLIRGKKPKQSELLSDECNQRLWEIYTIARANGISDKELFG